MITPQLHMLHVCMRQFWVKVICWVHHEQLTCRETFIELVQLIWNVAHCRWGYVGVESTFTLSKWISFLFDPIKFFKFNFVILKSGILTKNTNTDLPNNWIGSTEGWISYINTGSVQNKNSLQTLSLLGLNNLLKGNSNYCGLRRRGCAVLKVSEFS